jgi:hypothetical protein
MISSFRHVDRLLRGEATTVEALRDGIRVPASALVFMVIVLGMTYGACMGMFAVTGGGNDSWLQIPASMVKLPLLFLLTLVVTFPSLYVFNALVGSRLSLLQLLRLLVGAMTVMLAVLASLGPIVAFFSLSTTSYPFMVLLNVVVCAVSGVLGLAFLLQTLHRITVAGAPIVVAVNPEQPTPPPIVDPSDSSLAASDVHQTPMPPRLPGALDPLEGHVLARHVKTVFRIWVLVFALVGAQMSWVLRPFIGAPDKPFTFFRERGGNFFQAVTEKSRQLFDDGTERRGPERQQRQQQQPRR